MGVFLGSATADVEIRAMAIAVPLHPAQGKVYTDLSFPRNIVGGLRGAPKSEKLTRWSRARHLQNGVDGKLFDQRPLLCAVILRTASSTGAKNLDSEKSNRGELRSVELLACGRISMRHAHPFVTTANDFQWRSVPIASGESHITELGMIDPTVRFRFCKKESVAQSQKLLFARWRD
jgi:hypothetical protein